MIIRWHCCNGLSGCDITDEIELEDDLTDAEIEEVIRDEVFQRIEWSWKRSDEA